MGELRVFTVQNAIANLVSNDKQAEDAFAVIKYDNKPALEVPLTKDADKFMEQFRFSTVQESGGMSAINDALNLAIEALDSVSGFKNKIAVIFTDGSENASKINQVDLVEKAKSKGIKVFAIDFGKNTDSDYMNNLAELTGGCYDHIYKTNEFNSIFNAIYKRMENVYTLEYMPSSFGNVQLKMVICNNSKKIEISNSFKNEIRSGNRVMVNLSFDSNKSNIKSTFKAEIERLAAIIQKEPIRKFEIQAHTDEAGDGKTNLSLSQKRADALKAELLKKGIDQGRISAKGFGKSVPLADGKTKEGKLLTKRIELVVVEW
jgi:outer membrane protein OmpA-like peptidoglycan-associated protein